jgi:excisionase family DNA binding protein
MPKASIPNGAPAILSRTEVSAIFGVSRSTITRWARQGKLPCINTLGGHRRYMRDDVLRLLEEAKRPALPPQPRPEVRRAGRVRRATSRRRG